MTNSRVLIEASWWWGVCFEWPDPRAARFLYLVCAICHCQKQIFSGCLLGKIGWEEYRGGWSAFQDLRTEENRKLKIIFVWYHCFWLQLLKYLNGWIPKSLTASSDIHNDENLFRIYLILNCYKGSEKILLKMTVWDWDMKFVIFYAYYLASWWIITLIRWPRRPEFGLEDWLSSVPPYAWCPGILM